VALAMGPTEEEEEAEEVDVTNLATKPFMILVYRTTCSTD